MSAGIDFLTPMIVPGGQVVIAAGAMGNILATPGTFSTTGGRRTALKRIDAVNTVAGAAGNLTLATGLDGTLLLLAIGASLAGDRVVWEFPVPVQGRATFTIAVAAGMGTWAFIANGFVM